MENQRLCANYDENEGICKLACPYCVEPFSDEACIKFHERVRSLQRYPTSNKPKSYYVPSKQIGFSEKTEQDLKRLITRCNFCQERPMATVFLSDEELEWSNVEINVLFEIWRDMVIEKLRRHGHDCEMLFTWRNYNYPILNKKGSLFIGIGPSLRNKEHKNE